MPVSERTKLWIAGATATGIVGFIFFMLNRISNFVDRFSFKLTLDGIRISIIISSKMMMQNLCP